MVVVLCTSTKVYADGNECDPDYDPCGGAGTWWTYTAPIYHPLFPTCEIDVEVVYQFCPITGKYFYRILNYYYPNADTTNSDCTALIAWLAADPSRKSLIYELAMEKQASVLFTNFLAEHPGDTRGICPNGYVSYVGVIAKCNGFCNYEDMVLAKMIVVPKKCTDDCCVIEHRMCWNAATQSVIDTRIVTPTGSSTQLCSESTITCAPSIVRKNLVGTGTHTVLLDSVDECVSSTTCE